MQLIAYNEASHKWENYSRQIYNENLKKFLFIFT